MKPSLLRRSIVLPTVSRDQGWALLGFVSLAVFLFRTAVFEGRALFRRDVAMVWLPQVETFARCLAAGSWPLWDPYRGFGQPLLADPNSEVLYPPAWVHLIVPPNRSYVIFILFHLCVSAWGVYNLARRWGASPVGAFAGGAVWMASAPCLSLVSVWHHLAGAAWMPWVLLAADRALTSGTRRATALWGAAIAGQILTGSPDMVALTAAAITVDLAIRWVRWRRPAGPENRRLVVTAAGAIVLGLSLSALQWIPSVTLARGSLRGALPEFVRATWSLPPLGAFEILLPFHWLDLPLRPEVLRFVVGLGGSFLDFYIGVPALALAVAAFMDPKGRQVVTLGALAFLATVVALGPHGYLYSLVVELAPPLKSFRYPMKVMVLTDLAVALLVALGFDAWQRVVARPLRRWLAVGAVGLLAVVVLTAFWLVRTRAPSLFLQSGATAGLDVTVHRLTIAGATAVGALCLTICASLPRPWRWRGATVALAALSIGDLAVALPDLNPTARPGIYKEVPAVLSVLDKSEYARLYVVDYAQLTRHQRATTPWLAGAMTVAAIPAGWGPSETLFTGALQYLQPPGAARWRRFGSYDQDLLGLGPPFVSELNRFVREAEPDWVRTRMLQMAGVSDVVALEPEPWWESLRLVAEVPSLFRQPIRVLRVPHPLPRTYVVGKARVVDDSGLLDAIANPAFDPTNEVILSSPAPLPPGPATPSGSGQSRIVQWRPDQVLLEAHLDAPGYVVLLDGYDPGWHATLDALPATMVRANGAFRAVPVPAGAHRIEFRYRPRSVILGLAVSVSALLGLFWAGARAKAGAGLLRPTSNSSMDAPEKKTPGSES